MIIVPEHLILPSASPWSILQLLAWFNGGTSAELLTCYGIRNFQRSGAMLGYSIEDMLARETWRWRGQGEEPRLGRYGLSKALKRRSAHVLLGSHQALIPELRTCRICIRHGHHSVLHQLASVQLCYLHAQRLYSSCASCGSHANYSIVKKATPYGCSTCPGRGEDEDWRPQLPAGMAGQDRLAVVAFRDFIKRGVRVPVVIDCNFFRFDIPTYEAEIRTACLTAWTIYQSLPAPSQFIAMSMDPLPDYLTVQPYQSSRGELLRLGAQGQPCREVAMGLREMAEAIAREFIERCSRDHPCLQQVSQMTGAMTPARIQASPCPVARGYLEWRHAVAELAEHLHQAGEVPGVRVAGALEEVAIARRSELYLLAGERVRTPDLHRVWEGRQRRQLSSWVRGGFSEIPALVSYLRPRVEYGAWLGQQACPVPRRLRRARTGDTKDEPAGS